MSYCTDVTDISTLSKRQDLLFAVLASLEYTKTKVRSPSSSNYHDTDKQQADIKLIARLLGETYDAVQYRLRTPKNVASAMVSQLREGRGQSQPRPAPKKIKKTGTSGARGSRRGKRHASVCLTHHSHTVYRSWQGQEQPARNL